MKFKRSKSYIRIQIAAVVIFVLFEIIALQYMRGFFQSKLNLFIGIAFTFSYGISVIYDLTGESPHEEEINHQNKTSQRNRG